MKTTRNFLTASTQLAMCAAALLLTPSAFSSEKDTLNTRDVNFVKGEAAAGKAELKIAELAVTKASRTDVKAFATTLVTDHSAVNTELAGLATKKGVEISSVIAPAHASVYQDLEKLSGPEFDKEFLKTIIADHKKCIKNFEESATEGKDDDLRVWVNKTLPALRSHLATAEALSAVGSSGQ